MAYNPPESSWLRPASPRSWQKESKLNHLDSSASVSGPRFFLRFRSSFRNVFAFVDLSPSAGFRASRSSVCALRKSAIRVSATSALYKVGSAQYPGVGKRTTRSSLSTCRADSLSPYPSKPYPQTTSIRPLALPPSMPSIELLSGQHIPSL